MATDEELAEQVCELPESDRTAKWQRNHRDYTAEVEMLSAVFDRIGELIRVTAAVHGGRGKPPPPAPRPVHAVERFGRRRAKTRHQQLVSRLMTRKPEQ